MRLIDGDALKEKFLDMGCLDDKPCYGAEILDRMPTVCDINAIRAEINKQAWEIAISDTDRANGMWDVVRIIDKYIGRK